MGGISLLRAFLCALLVSFGNVSFCNSSAGAFGFHRALPGFFWGQKLRRESPKLRLTSQKCWFGALKLMLSRRMDTYCIYDSTPSGRLNPRGERHGCGCESETMDFNLLIMIAMMALLAWMMFSAQKRQRKQVEELRAMQQSLVPGTQVMTGSGIYGTVVSTDLENNKLQLQIAEGVVITASMNAILSLVEEEAPAAPLTEDVYEATASEAPASETSSDTAK